MIVCVHTNTGDLMERKYGNDDALLLDMDGVIFDTMGGLFEHMEELHGHSLAHEDIKDYWFSGLPKELILSAMRRKGFYRNLTPITGAIRGVNRLREEYDGNIFICSSPMQGADFCETEKRDALEEYFGADFAREAIITKDKTLALGRVIVEDNPDIGGGTWQPVMFDQPYNRHITEYPRMHGWHDLQVIRDCMNRARNK